MTSTVTRSVPPAGLIRAINPAVRLMLTSPLHRPLDSAALLLHVTGKKTGRGYHIPVNYTAIDGKLIVVTIARWRVNLRGGADLEVTWQGRRRPMHALLEEEPAAVAVAYDTLIQHIGWPRASRQLGIATTDGQPPTVVALKDAAREYGWSVITLTPR
jgi:hypothetical protein